MKGLARVEGWTGRSISCSISRCGPNRRETSCLPPSADHPKPTDRNPASQTRMDRVINSTLQVCIAGVRSELPLHLHQ